MHGRSTQEDLATVATLLRTLEESHRRWKSTHVTMATRMLGDARGSGYTSGVGYLSQWVDHRLFWALPGAQCLRSGSQRLAISLKLGVSLSDVIAS